MSFSGVFMGIEGGHSVRICQWLLRISRFRTITLKLIINIVDFSMYPIIESTANIQIHGTTYVTYPFGRIILEKRLGWTWGLYCLLLLFIVNDILTGILYCQLHLNVFCLYCQWLYWLLLAVNDIYWLLFCIVDTISMFCLYC